MADPKQMTDFVEADLGGPRAGDVCLCIGDAVKRYQCGLAAQLGFTV